ncbi:MAG: lysophospholipid acyltransferase family protein [Wenzhouxiangellaceae bacterium]|nr:lysophospholipid acyltransferase family protein [Wenzhouxiangellaceae bacterium]
MTASHPDEDAERAPAQAEVSAIAGAVYGLPPVAPPVRLQPWRYLYRLPLLLVWLLALPILMLVMLPGLRTLRVGSRRLGGCVQQTFARALARILGFRLEIVGDWPPGPVLVVANHISWFDIVLLHALAPMWLVAKSGIRDWPVIGAVARSVGTIFIERGHEGSRRSAARRMTALLRRGEIVGLFPEAGISAGRGVGRFHARLFGAALRAGVPVLPVAIRYWRDGDVHDEHVFGPGKSLLGLALSALGRPGCRGQILIGPRLEPGDSRSELARRAQHEVQRLYARVHD